MKFTVNGRDIIVKFRYQRRNPRARVHTFCDLSILKDGEITGLAAESSAGEAICDSRDQFIKTVGRKRALRNALSNAGLQEMPKTARTELWKQYFATTHELAK